MLSLSVDKVYNSTYYLNRRVRSVSSKALSKKLLNYYATFTETKFNFSRLITYKWSDNELSLDIGLYSEFAQKLIKSSTDQDVKEIVIKKGEFAIEVDSKKITTPLMESLSSDYSADFLKRCIEDAQTTKRVFSSDGSGNTEEVAQTDDGANRASYNEGVRTFNLAVRKKLDDIVTVAHRQRVEQLKKDNNLTHVPSSTFNQRVFTQRHFDALQSIAVKNDDASKYHDEVKKYFADNIHNITIYDLYFNLYDYTSFVGMGTLYAFFHSLKAEKYNFPLYFIELELRSNPNEDEIVIQIPRDITLLNTPAINIFKFDNVLTLPRSTTRKQAGAHIRAMQTYLQTMYKVSTSFIESETFEPIFSETEDKPSVYPRVGLQVIKNEDKKLLDYSEIHAAVDHGDESKFTTFIQQYIEGRVPSFQEETDQLYKERYPQTSAARYIHDNPLPLNASQKRILTAVQNDKNSAIVVDGPPGTGKSHTIAAITYWANQNNKSLVITSHKKEALDVIERMLEKKFKTIHPHAKPSILRLSRNTQSHNSINNTLASPVIVAASDRSLEANVPAIESDLREKVETLTDSITNKIEAQKDYEQYLADQVRLDILSKELSPTYESIDSFPKVEVAVDFEKITSFLDSIPKLRAKPISELKGLLPLRDNADGILRALEALHHNNALESVGTSSDQSQFSEDFVSIIKSLEQELVVYKPIMALDPKDDINGGRFKKFKKRNNVDNLQSMLDELRNIKHAGALSNIAAKNKKSKQEVTLSDAVAAIAKSEKIRSNQSDIAMAELALKNPVFSGLTPEETYQSLQQITPVLSILNAEQLNEIENLFASYGDVLKDFGIDASNVHTLTTLNSNSSLKQWLALHNDLSMRSKQLDNRVNTGSNNYQSLTQKLLEHQNDERLKKLNQHVNEIAQIKQRYDNGRRLSEEQTKLLLENISVIIAEPEMISKYLPMTEELIDMLIIDEASQVSIADSISVMLRAKQVIVFGDEYQYGAVSAQNVSTKYSSAYFKEIIDAYKDDYNVDVSEQAEQNLLKDLLKDQTEDDPIQQVYEKPNIDQGTIDWLKTFDIRTSTLSFTKAIANYSTSLKEHFRSFPEIIDYSNEVFYRPAQMELVVNRIRTQPITQTLIFEHIETKGKTGANVNLDEIIFIADDIKKRLENGFKGSIGVITSFREQQQRLEEYLREHFNYRQLQKDHDLAVWFVRDVQGEERDIVYYSFVEDKKLGNADLKSIYPVVGGVADSPRSIKMQQLNVGFSRAKDTMVFVHSMPIGEYSSTRLGDALKFYQDSLAETEKSDHFIADTSIFDSPQEEYLYKTILQTDFYAKHKEHLHIVPQFEIGKYLKAEYAAQIPKYRTDFLLTYTKDGAQQSALMEYDGVEFHYKNPSEVTAHKLSQEFTEYDIARQLELESYGYRFIRINKFTLRPDSPGKSDADMLSEILQNTFTK